MATNVTAPSGMRDLLPSQVEKRGQAMAVIRSVYRQHGFDEIETPAFIDARHLAVSQAGENDKLTYRILRRDLRADDVLYNLQRSGGPLDDALSDSALRYDLTFPLARYYATNQREFPGTLRSLQIGPVWRAERSQKGRFRQFVQCDIDILGAVGETPEVELLYASYSALKALEVGPFSFRVSDRQLLEIVLSTVGILEPNHRAAMNALDRLDKASSEEVESELVGLGLSAHAVHEVVELLTSARHDPRSVWERVRAISPNAERVLKTDLRAIVDQVNELAGEEVAVVDLSIVRGLDYYTNTVFEVRSPRSRSSIAGGGRYDGMVGHFGRESVPACGISLGFERLVDLLHFKPSASRSVVLFAETDNPRLLMRVKKWLIDDGWRVRVEARPKYLAKSLDQYRDLGYTHYATIKADPLAFEDVKPMRAR